MLQDVEPTPPFFLVEAFGHVNHVESLDDLLNLEPMMVEETTVLTDSEGRLLSWNGPDPADGVSVVGAPGSAERILERLGLPRWPVGVDDLEVLNRHRRSW